MRRGGGALPQKRNQKKKKEGKEGEGEKKVREQADCVGKVRRGQGKNKQGNA